MRKNRICCSKKIIVASYVITILLTALCVAGIWAGLDTTPLVTLACCAWAETTAANAFYFWKAKCENRIKLTKSMVQSMGEKYGIDAVARIAEITLSND